MQAAAQDAGALRARYEALRESLATSAFGLPLKVASSGQRGEVYAVIEQPYGELAPSLGQAARWCDILLLIVTVKRCEASRAARAQRVSAFITRKPRDALDGAERIDLGYRVVADSGDYLHVVLSAPTGPAGTRNYEIGVEAVALDDRRSFVHLSYSCELGLAARLAMGAYLETSGRGKVGFSVVERRADGTPVYVGGMRGVAERNAMRYYLAVKAYLDSLAAPPPQRLEARLREWYAGIERYPRQLKESIGAEEYLAMKRREASS